MLEVKHLKKRYTRKTEVLKDINFTIPDGEIVALLGANGVGKTTCLKCMTGIEEFTEGTVIVDGKENQWDYEELAFISEEGSFLPFLSANKYGEFLADFFPKFDRERYEELLRLLEVDENQKIEKMSKGQRMKVEVAAGFAKHAKYIFMDEPFTGLDVFTRDKFLKLLIGQLQGEETILLSTHDINDIENFVDRALILRDGVIQSAAYVDDLRMERKSLVEYFREEYEKE